jgi:predicted DNA-binding ribbon-helix-helix protein
MNKGHNTSAKGVRLGNSTWVELMKTAKKKKTTLNKIIGIAVENYINSQK